jgi:hypothetical protein
MKIDGGNFEKLISINNSTRAKCKSSLRLELRKTSTVKTIQKEGFSLPSTHKLDPSSSE